MNLLEKFIQTEKVFLQNHTFLLAISGGIDSVVLCDLFAKGNANFFIAHCNFQLRGEESERDESFVRSLAVKYGKEIFVKKFDTLKYAEENKLSIQVTARNLRYEWFRELIESARLLVGQGKLKVENEKSLTSSQLSTVNYQPSTIATAHHADDNIETVTMNFFRGTGLKGLTGMDTHNKEIYRPLLHYRKADIVLYAKENQLEFVEDSSNANNYYTRNFFRNELLPAVSKIFSNVEENILHNIQRLSEAEGIYNEAIEGHKKRLIEVVKDEWHIPILKLQRSKFHRTILWEIIKEKNFSAAQVDEAIKLMNADNGSYIESVDFRIIKNRKWLIITSKLVNETNPLIIIGEHEKKVAFRQGVLQIENINASAFTISTDKNIAALDLNDIEFPLLLRKWKQGDYFYPLGMKKKKKLSKFFIDQKLSLTQKENVWVLEMNKKIIWIIGHRIDERFKVLPTTTNVLKIKFQP